MSAQTQTSALIQFARRIADLQGSVARHILSRPRSPNLISFAGGLPSPELLNSIQLPEIPSSAFQYGPSEGDPELRSLVADRLNFLNLPVSAENLLITTGSQQGLDLISKLFIDHGAQVALESPTYLAALQNFRLFGANFTTLALPRGSDDFSQWENSLTASRPRFLYLNPTFQNPTGYCYSQTQRIQIAEILDRLQIPLIEDDPYREITFESSAPPPISSFLKKAPWIYLSTVSKTLLPGLRIGSLACSRSIFTHLLKLKQAADLHSSRTSQAIAVSLLSDLPNYQRRIAQAIDHYREKRDAMSHALTLHFSNFAGWDSPQGGMFFWIRLRKRQPLFQRLETALQHDVAFMPGDPFFTEDSDSGHYLRLNFSHPSLPQIASGIDRLARVFAQ